MMQYANQTEFLEAIGFKINHHPWSIHLQWSTTEPKFWVLRRNALSPSDLLLTLSLNDRYWNLSLQRKDDIFGVIWRDSGIDVKSQQLKYRKMIQWPAIKTPFETIAAIKTLEAILDVTFYKHVNLQGTLAESLANPTLFTHWLGDSAASYGCFE